MKQMAKMVLAIAGTGILSAIAADPSPMAWFNSAGEMAFDGTENCGNFTLGPNARIEDAGRYGKGLRFCGTRDSWAQFTCEAVTNTTIAFWVKLDAQDSSIPDANGNEQNTYVYLMGNGYSGMAMNFYRNSQSLSFINQHPNPQLSFVAVNNTLTREKWHHVAITVEYTGDDAQGQRMLKCRSYRNGVEERTADWLLGIPFRTGRQTVVLGNNMQNGIRPASAMMADVRFYREALSAGDILRIINDGQTAKGPWLAGRWSFDSIGQDASGAPIAPECTGHASAMTLGSAMRLCEGVEGTALEFSGTENLGGAATMADVMLGEYTVCAWVKRSPLAPECFSASANPYPRFFDISVPGNAYCQFGTLEKQSLEMSFVPPGCGTSSQTASHNAISDIDVWSHVAIVTRYVKEGENAGKAVADFYLNGKLAQMSRQQAFDLAYIPPKREIKLGNTWLGANRYFCGAIDDFRIYCGALSAEQVASIYKGLAEISAGEDFATVSAETMLRGRAGNNAPGNVRQGYSGTVSWTLVSAPEGGEGAQMLQPQSPSCAVVLPVEGEYVFRMTVSGVGVSAHSDVTVTRVAANPANVPPALMASCGESAGWPAPVALTAEAQDDGLPSGKTRVFWRKVSGPGGVWFEPSGEPGKYNAHFSEPGEYAIEAVAEDGQDTSRQTFALTVGGDAASTIGTGLARYWSLDDRSGLKVESESNLDSVTAKFVPGKFGYAARAFAHSGPGAYFDTGTTTGETVPAGAGNNASPANKYLTISAWVYVEPNDTNNVCGASVIGQSYGFGLRYREKFTHEAQPNTGGFTLYQQGLNAAGSVGWTMVHYPAPAVSPAGRWMHLLAVLVRNESAKEEWEMWYDGVKQTPIASTSNDNSGRYRSDSVLIAGMNYTSTTKSSSDYNSNWSTGIGDEYYSRTFPGLVDEVALWTRKLTLGEIAYLASAKIHAPNRAPVAEVVPLAKPAVRKVPFSLNGVVSDDGLPAESAVSCRWSVLSGNPDDVDFESADSAETTVTVRKAGRYLLQLEASDGERTGYSEPFELVVRQPGMVIAIR